MITVKEAERIVLGQAVNYGNEYLPFQQALGRVLTESIVADRDFPPYDRVTMDGIAIRFEGFRSGIRNFDIKAVQAAGDDPIDISENECIEIMTGASLPPTSDTIVRYE